MKRERIKKVIAWVMFTCGVAGAVFSAAHVIAPGEPTWVLQLSWAAVWVTGVVGLIAADDTGLSDEDVERVARRVVALSKEAAA